MRIDLFQREKLGRCVGVLGAARERGQRSASPWAGRREMRGVERGAGRGCSLPSTVQHHTTVEGADLARTERPSPASTAASRSAVLSAVQYSPVPSTVLSTPRQGRRPAVSPPGRKDPPPDCSPGPGPALLLLPDITVLPPALAPAHPLDPLRLLAAVGPGGHPAPATVRPLHPHSIALSKVG